MWVASHVRLCSIREYSCSQADKLTTIIVSQGRETADWIIEDDIDMTGLVDQSTVQENVIGVV